MSNAAPASWHVADWGWLGWLETGVKLLGMGACVMALDASTGPLGIGRDLRSLTALLLAALTLMTVVAVYLRFLAREVVAFAFAVLNAAAHLAGVVSLLRASPAFAWLTVFGTCFVGGEIVKQIFLRRTGYTELGRSNDVIIGIARRILLAYGVFTALTLLAH